MRVFHDISPRLKVYILLAPFIAIYFIDSGCTIANVSHDMGWFSNSQEVQSHGGHHGDGHDHSNHHDSENSNESEEDEDDGCCKEYTSAFFASVQIHNTQFESNSPPVKIIIIKNVVINYLFEYSLGFEFISAKRPPPYILPKYPDTRVFIQSFQI